MNGLVFTRRMDAHSHRVLHTDVTLSDGRYLAINATRRTGMVELSLSSTSSTVSQQTWMEFTPEQARALATELLACADAHKAMPPPGARGEQ